LPLELEHEGLVALSGDLLQAQLACPVAAQVRIHGGLRELGEHVPQGGARQLGVKQAAVAGHAAARRARRDAHVFGESTGDRAQLLAQPEMPN